MTSPRTVLITGATDGLGRALAGRLAADGIGLILHGRDQARLDEVADDLAGHGIPLPTTVRADLADLGQVRRMAADIRAITGELDVLVSNAGVGRVAPGDRTRCTSADGYELRLAVNYLAGFLLALELLPLLRAAAPARIVNVASLAQHPLDFGDLMLEDGYSASRAYGQSKLAQIMSGFELATRLPPGEVTVNSLHPATHMPTKMILVEFDRGVDTLEEGVHATHRLVTDSALSRTTGRFYDRLRQAQAHSQAYDTATRRRLWDISLELTGASG